MLLNVSYEKKVKLSSTKGRKVNTRNNSRGDNHSPSKRNLEKTEQYRPVNNRDSLSNGPSDLNKKLKILTTRNRCSADLISNSVISKKEMKKLEREQRIYELYMKAPYKLMDKQ
jgi:3-methyladenine DNA glycosylase Mpg